MSGDTESVVLLAMLWGPKRGVTTPWLVEQTGRSYTTCRNHLRVMMYRNPPWIERVGREPKVAGKPASAVFYRLSDAGRNVAELRDP